MAEILDKTKNYFILRRMARKLNDPHADEDSILDALSVVQEIAKKGGDISSVISSVERELTASDNEIAFTAVGAAIYHYMNKGLMDKAEELIEHENENVRNGAVKTLSEDAEKGVDISYLADALESRLKDSSDNVRCSAAVALTYHYTDKKEPDKIEGLMKMSPEIGEYVANAVREMTDPQSVFDRDIFPLIPALGNVLEHSTTYLKRFELDLESGYITEYGFGDKFEEHLAEQFKRAKEKIETVLCDYSAKCLRNKEWDKLERILEIDNEKVKNYTAGAICRFVPLGVTKENLKIYVKSILIAKPAEFHKLIWPHKVEAGGSTVANCPKCGRPGFKGSRCVCGEKITGSIDSAEKQTKEESIGDLIDFDGEMIRILGELLSDEDVGVRRNAAHTLSEVKDDIGPALEPLINALDDEDGKVALNASEALKNHEFAGCSYETKIKSLMILAPKEGVDLADELGDDYEKLLQTAEELLEHEHAREGAFLTFHIAAKMERDISCYTEILEKHLEKENNINIASALTFEYVRRKEWGKIEELMDRDMPEETIGNICVALRSTLHRHDIAPLIPFMAEKIEKSSLGISIGIIGVLAEAAKNGTDTSPAADCLVKRIESEDRHIMNPTREALKGVSKEAFADALRNQLRTKETHESAFEDLIRCYHYSTLDSFNDYQILTSLQMLSQFFHNYAKGCEEGNAPVLKGDITEHAAKLLIMGQVVYWNLTGRSFVFDHIRENKMDRIVAEDAIEKNLPEGWIRYVKKYVTALHEGAKDDKEKEFLGKIIIWENQHKEFCVSNKGRKAWDFFYVNHCISPEDRRRYKGFVKGKRTGKELKLGRAVYG